MKAGILLTDTETSCLIEGPSRFCASEWFSRKAQKARAWVSFWASAASSTRPFFQRLAEIGFHLFRKPGLVGAGAARPGRRPFEQHVPVMALGQRIGRAGDVLQHQVDALAAHQLAGGDVVLARGMGAAQQRHRCFGRRHGDPRGRDILGLGPQFQHRLGDDAQSALGAEIEVAQVVAGIVLLERAQAVPDLALRRAPLRGRARAGGRCRNAAPARRRHWSRGCRRWCSFPRRRGSGERGGRAGPRSPGWSSAPRRPRRSSSSRSRRPRRCGSCG